MNTAYMDDWTSVTISKKRLNGLKLRANEENRRSVGNTLDTILKNAGILELSEKELDRKIQKLKVEVVNS